MDPILVTQAGGLVLALPRSAVVGRERRLRGHPAGFHTRALGCSRIGRLRGGRLGHERQPPRRRAGPRGDGQRLPLRRGVNIQGVDTATTPGCVSAVGVLCAADRASPGCMVASAARITRVRLPFVEQRISKSAPIQQI